MDLNDWVTLVSILVIRLGVPFTVLRWPFWGGLLCIAADASDVMIRDALGSHVMDGHWYHTSDKLLDTYYLAFEAYVAWGWQDAMARWTAEGMFALRVAGLLFFELTGIRQTFLFTPAVFENFYLVVAGFLTFNPNWRIGSWKRWTIIILVVLPPKLAQEYVMHYREFGTWNFVKHNILFWPD